MKKLEGKVFWSLVVYFIIMTLIHDFLKPLWWVEGIISLVLAFLVAYVFKIPHISKKK